MYLWVGFIVCLVAQFIVLAAIDEKIFTSTNSFTGGFDADSHRVKQCLVFLPTVTFGMCVDVQIISSTRSYKSVAFSELPFRCSRAFMMLIAVLACLTSVVAYAFCLLLFGGIQSGLQMRELVYGCFIAKAILWSPFLAMEYYNTLFE